MGSWWQLTPKSSIVQRTFFVSMALITGSCFLPHCEAIRRPQTPGDCSEASVASIGQDVLTLLNIAQHSVPMLGTDCTQ